MKQAACNTLAMLWLVMQLSACGGDIPGINSDQSEKVVLIATQKVQVRDLPVWLETVGQIRSKSAPTLAAEVEGRITRVAADTGDEIEAGQLLAETDTSALLLQQQAAKAGLERLDVHIANGERRVDRYTRLAAKDLSSQIQLDDAREQLEAYRADYKAAIAQLAIVQDLLVKSRVIAPVSGVIEQRFIAEGDFVKRGQALFAITRPGQLQAWLPYPESVALQVKVGQPMKIFSPLTPGEMIAGTVTELQPSVGSGSRAVMAIFDLKSPGNLRPGATLSGQVRVETRKSAVLVPVISIVRRPAGEVVYVISTGKAEARVVTTGHIEAGLVEIISGLEGSETVATDGAAFLTDGVRVKIAEPLN